ncbi:MAG: hypothetical protein ACSHYF_14600 [Verrucomicrobiaceae bacterium]
MIFEEVLIHFASAVQEPNPGIPPHPVNPTPTKTNKRGKNKIIRRFIAQNTGEFIDIGKDAISKLVCTHA